MLSLDPDESGDEPPLLSEDTDPSHHEEVAQPSQVVVNTIVTLEELPEQGIFCSFISPLEMSSCVIPGDTDDNHLPSEGQDHSFYRKQLTAANSDTIVPGVSRLKKETKKFLLKGEIPLKRTLREEEHQGCEEDGTSTGLHTFVSSA